MFEAPIQGLADTGHERTLTSEGYFLSYQKRVPKEKGDIMSKDLLLEEIDRLKGILWLIQTTIEKYLRHAETLVLTGQEEKAFLKVNKIRSIFTDFHQKNSEFIKEILEENLNYLERQS